MADAAARKRLPPPPNHGISSLSEFAVDLIFRQLDDWRDAYHLSLTCKQLHAAGQPHLKRSLGCMSCRHPVCDAAAAHEANAGSRSFPLHLDDGEAMCLGEPEGLSVRFGEEALCQSTRLTHQLLRQQIAATAADLSLRTRDVFCSRCNLYLGAQIVQVKGLRAGADLDMTNWRLGLVLGNVVMTKKYLSLLRPDGGEENCLPGISWQEFVALSVYRCSSFKKVEQQQQQQHLEQDVVEQRERCGTFLFTDRAVLSKHHWWVLSEDSNQRQADLHQQQHQQDGDEEENLDGDDGGVVVGERGQQAWYLSSIASAAISEGPPEEMELAQGKMTIRRVRCAVCETEIGWKFIGGSGKNIPFCGRFGVVAGRIDCTTLGDE